LDLVVELEGRDNRLEIRDRFPHCRREVLVALRQDYREEATK
jgi:hypothetical protein